MVRKQNDLGKDDIKQLVKRLAIPSMLADVYKRQGLFFLC